MKGLLLSAPTLCLSSLQVQHHSKFFHKRAYPYCRCTKNKDPLQGSVSQGFSVLKSDNRLDGGSLWSNMALYLFSIHVPLSFGGLSAISSILHFSTFDPQTEALSLVVLQALELIIVLLLLRYSDKPQYKLSDFFQGKELTRERSWLLASALGFGFLLFLVFVTSIIADCLLGTKEVNNPILKEILLSGPVSITSCILVYCVVTPLLEEIVYRGFFLTALSSTMKWQEAIIVSSVVFSAAHFSGENFIQLFLIGSVLGCCYCWSGDLRSSIAIHSLYNAVTLAITLVS